MKLKLFCMEKITISQRVQRLVKDFINYTSDRRLISKLYEELNKLDIKKTNNLIKIEDRSKQRILKR